MSITRIKLTGEVKLTYNENSKEFREALKGYRKIIDKNGNKDRMLEHVAFYVTRFGIDGIVEGVGYVGYAGNKPEEEPYSGIMIGKDFDDFSYEIQ